MEEVSSREALVEAMYRAWLEGDGAAAPALADLLEEGGELRAARAARAGRVWEALPPGLFGRGDGNDAWTFDDEQAAFDQGWELFDCGPPGRRHGVEAVGEAGARGTAEDAWCL